MKNRWWIALIVIAGAAVFVSTSKIWQGDSKNLNQPVAGGVGQLDPPPAMPKEAVQAEGRAEAAVKLAQSPSDYLEAAKEYQKALELAPWATHLYYNLGLVHEKAKEYTDAIRYFRLYLEVNPGAEDALDIEKEIAGLEYTIEKREPAVTEVPPAVPYVPEPAPPSLSGFWTANKKLDHTKWGTVTPFGPFEANVTEGSGRLELSVKDRDGGSSYDFYANKSGNQLTGTLTSNSSMGTFDNPFQGEISSDGNRIVLRSDYIWSYNGKQDRWVQKYDVNETWEFTR